jgi:uncharacterized membrane protein
MFCAGGRHITSRIKVEMHAFWSALIWLADTILFIWMGIMLAFILLPPSDPSVRILGQELDHMLVPMDAAYAVLLYVWLLVSLQALLTLVNARSVNALMLVPMDAAYAVLLYVWLLVSLRAGFVTLSGVNCRPCNALKLLGKQ